MKSHKKFLTTLVLSFASTLTFAQVQLTWGGISGGGHFFDVDMTTPLQGDLFDSSIGTFVQLISLGASGVNEGLELSESDATAGSNFVLDTAWMGRDSGFDGANGNFAQVSNIPANIDIFMRIWNAPSPDYNSGLAPTQTASHYIDTQIYQVGSFEIQQINMDSLSTISAVPEPGTMMLVLVGFATAVISVKRRRNRIN